MPEPQKQNTAEFELQGNTLYYLVDLALKPPQAIVDAINDKDAKVDVTAKDVSARLGSFGSKNFVHGKPQPEMPDTTSYRFDYKVTSGHAEGNASFTFDPAAVARDPQLAQHPEMKALVTGAYPKWKSAAEETQFISNLIDKDPLILVGTAKGKQIADRMRGELDESPFKKGEAQTPDNLITARERQVKEWTGKLREELRKEAPELKKEVLADVEANYAQAQQQPAPAKAPPAADLPPVDTNKFPAQVLADMAGALKGTDRTLAAAGVNAKMLGAMREFSSEAQIEIVPEKDAKGKIVIGEVERKGDNPLPAVAMSEEMRDLVKEHPEVLKAAMACAMAARALPAKEGETAAEKTTRLEKMDTVALAIDPDRKAFAELLDAANGGKAPAVPPAEVQKALQLMDDSDRTLRGENKETLIAAWKETMKSRAAGVGDTSALDSFAEGHPQQKASVEALKAFSKQFPPLAAGISGSENVQTGETVVQADLTTNFAERKARIEGRQ